MTVTCVIACYSYYYTHFGKIGQSFLPKLCCILATDLALPKLVYANKQTAKLVSTDQLVIKM
jgi:hypothetical protein